MAKERSGLSEMKASRAMLFGLGAAVLFLGGLTSWSVYAPLEAGAAAPGYIAVDSRRKQVQHLDGGIVREILVQEGERVETGQVLLQLDETQSRVERDILVERLIAAKAQELRLIAERDGAQTMPIEVLKAAFPSTTARVGEVMDGQRQILDARIAYMVSQTALSEQRQAQLGEEIIGLQAEIAAQREQLGYIQEEVDAVMALVDKGLERRPRLLALQREMAEIKGRMAANQAAVARARQQIGEAKLQLIDTETRLKNSVVEELRTIQTEISSLREELSRAQSVLDRTIVRAPDSGSVVAMVVNTVGGVVQPGATLMEVVPTDDRLIVEAQISPLDIDAVHVGLPAKIRLGSFTMDQVPELDAVVTVLSADRLIDEANGNPYYSARLSVDDSVLPDGIVLQPGMPADTLIITGQRTVLQYIVEPFEQRLRKAFSGG